MKVLEDFYAYPWTSYEANNANTFFIDGDVPALIDPGHTPLFKHVLEGMARDGKTPDSVKLIICTHGHPDHIEAVQMFGNNVLKAISAEEYAYLANSGRELFLMTGCQMPAKPFQIFLKEGQLKLGKKRLRVFLTPGHSPGSICLYWEEKKLLISGDTVFYMGIGRTDFPGGDLKLLSESIKRLSKLDIEYLVPGHGEVIKGRKTIEKNFSLILKEFF